MTLDTPASPVVLPTQNQLYALFMNLCGTEKIKKPPKCILDLLEEDTTSRALRLEREAGRLQVDQGLLEAHDSESNVAARDDVVPLASRTTLRLVDRFHASSAVLSAEQKVHIGNRGLLVWLRLVAECPLATVLDLSNVTSMFAVDAFARGPTGHEVVECLCSMAESHPSLLSIDLRGQFLGTVSGRRCVEAVTRNRRLVEFFIDTEGVDRLVVQDLATQLQHNRAKQATLPPPSLPTCLSTAVLALDTVDRKTSRQRQCLRNILSDKRAFDVVAALPHTSTAAFTQDVLDAMIDAAELISLETMIKDSAGLRGDREHLFIIESGSVQVWISNVPFVLARGDYYGHAYESAMFSAGMIQEKERGAAFRIPFVVCRPLLQRWESCVQLFYPTIKTCAALQGAHVWMLLRACHTAETVEVLVGNAVVKISTPFHGLMIVASGSCGVLDASASAALASSMRSPTSPRVAANFKSRSIELLDQTKASDELLSIKKALAAATKQLATMNRSESPTGRDASPVSAFANQKPGDNDSSLRSLPLLPCFTFAPGDVFGEEPLTLKRVPTYATEIIAVAGSEATPAAATVVRLLPEGAAPIVDVLRHALRITTRQYSRALVD